MMPSSSAIRNYDQTLGIGLVVLLVVGLIAGLILSNWALVERWLPRLILAVALLLFYRLVVAVEYLAYDS